MQEISYENYKTHLSFEIRFTQVLKSVRIYQLIIKENPDYQTFSYLFRYNTLSSLYQTLNPNVYQKVNFPPKVFMKTRDRSNEFLEFFQNFSIKVLKTELNDEHISRFSENFQIYIENPFEQGRMFALRLNQKYYEFYTLKMLDEGGYGKVYLCSFGGKYDEKLLFALKLIKFQKGNDYMMRSKLMNCIINESSLLPSLKHENIVRSYFYFKTRIENRDYFCNLMEYCNGGTLYDYLMKKKKHYEFLSEEEIVDILLQILKGMQYIRWFFQSKGNNEGFMHLNLNPYNILFHKNDKKQRIIKICDFSLAKKYPLGKKILGDSEATVNFQSPQMAEGKISEKCDIWSIGVILYLMCFEKFPWPEQRRSFITFRLQEDLLNHQELSLENSGRKISPKLQKLIKKMIVFSEEDRIGWEDLFENELFKKELEKDFRRYSRINKKNNENLYNKAQNFYSHKNTRSLSDLKDFSVKNTINDLQTRRNSNSMESDDKIDEKFAAHLDILLKYNEKNVSIKEENKENSKEN